MCTVPPPRVVTLAAPRRVDGGLPGVGSASNQSVNLSGAHAGDFRLRPVRAPSILFFAAAVAVPQHTLYFRDVSLEEVEHFRIRVRPLREVVIRNIAVRPDVRTEPKADLAEPAEIAGVNDAGEGAGR